MLSRQDNELLTQIGPETPMADQFLNIIEGRGVPARSGRSIKQPTSRSRASLKSSATSITPAKPRPR